VNITKDVRISGSPDSTIELALNFSKDEIDSVFAANNDPLFAKIFSPRWEGLTDSEKLRQLMELQIWLEGLAENINLEGGKVVPKLETDAAPEGE
jgi:hypothetical protein